MNGSKGRMAPEINLEEFERRLRAAGTQQSAVEDPLEELTRLVNTIATERPRGEKVVEIAAARAPSVEPPRLPANDVDSVDAPLGRPSRPQPQQAPTISVSLPRTPSATFVAPMSSSAAPSVSLPRVPLTAAAPPTAPEPEPAAASAEMAALRPSFEEAFEKVLAEPQENEFEVEDDPPYGAETVVTAPEGRPASWYFKIGSLVTVGLLFGAGVVAMKVGIISSGPKAPPMIMADASPNKVAPPSEAAVQSPGDSGALLMKDSATPAPVKVVSNEEQPVDLKAGPASAAPDASSPVAPTVNTPIVPTADSYASAPPVVDADARSRPCALRARADPEGQDRDCPAGRNAALRRLGSRPRRGRARRRFVGADAAGRYHFAAPDRESDAAGQAGEQVRSAHRKGRRQRSRGFGRRADAVGRQPDPGKAGQALADQAAPARAGNRESRQRRRRRLRPRLPRRPPRPPPAAAIGRCSSRPRVRKPTRKPRSANFRRNTARISAARRSASTRPTSTATRSIACAPPAIPRRTPRRCAPS